MRVMVLVKATADSETGPAPRRADLEEMGRFNQELEAAGILRQADGLKPSRYGARVAFDRQARSVSEGPFPHPEELVAGFWIWEVEDLEEAIAWVKRCPNPMPGPSVIEVRPIWDGAELD